MTLGPQFQTLYRGLTVTPDKVDLQNLGMHWTPDKGIAEEFATFDTEGNPGPGTVITAAVHRRHVTDWRSSPNAFNPQIHREREVPLRKGAIVHIQGIEHLDDEPTSVDIPTRRRIGRA
jgi:hypothetical protein